MGFESCHPAVNLIFYVAAIYGSIVFDNPVFIAISYLCAFAYSVKRNGKKALVFNLCLLPFVLIFALYYSSYTHFGLTVVQKNFIGNNLTVESFVYGLTIGIRVLSVVAWCESLFNVFSSDKVVYLFGRVSPLLSLFLTIILRLIPRLKLEAKKINLAQKGIGKGTNQGNILTRIRNCIRVFSMLITWIIGALIQSSNAMRSRGSKLRGRTAFSIYRFDNRDRGFVIALFCGVTLTAMGVILDIVKIYYDPVIIIKPFDLLSVIIAVGYAFLCLMPLGLELWTEYKFNKARKSVLQ
jgi:energy-coupling factor transport system permease protein